MGAKMHRTYSVTRRVTTLANRPCTAHQERGNIAVRGYRTISVPFFAPMDCTSSRNVCTSKAVAFALIVRFVVFYGDYVQRINKKAKQFKREFVPL